MMNFLGLGPFRKGQSSSSNGKGESQGDVVAGGGSSSAKKSESSGTGGNGKDKDKGPAGNGKLVAEVGEAVVGKTGGGGNSNTSNKKGSKANEITTTASSSSTKVKLNKTISSGGGGGSSNNGNLRSSSTKAITQSYETHPTITSFGANGTAAAVVAGVIAAEDPAKKELDELKERASEVANEVKLLFFLNYYLTIIICFFKLNFSCTGIL